MEHTDYQVLAPDSVAWYIQAALVADRTGNVAARDLALDEAQRIAEQRRLIDHLAPLPGYDVAHECNGVRLAEIEARLATIERRQWEDAETFGEHARRMDGLEIGAPRRPGAYFIPGGRLTDIERRLGALERDTTTERLAREDIGLRLENVARRARLPLPSRQMHEAYDADQDAFPVSYWDMRLLAMIEQINDRLAGVAVVSEGDHHE